MAPALDIKLEIALDNVSDDNSRQQLRYFPGDTIEGKIFLEANQPITLRHFRLAWTGRVQVQPIQTNKESRIYFDECWKLSPHLIKSPTKVFKRDNKKTSKSRSFLSGTTNTSNRKGRHVPYYHTKLIPLSEATVPEPRIELQKNKPLGLTFKLQVPNDRPLPSSTQATCLPNRILYLLEAFIDNIYDELNDSADSNSDDDIEGKTDQERHTGSRSRKDRPVFFAQQVVPVFEPIFTRTTEMTMPFRAEQIFAVSLFSDLRNEFTAAMRVTIPCRGSEPGISVPVSITIWNNMEFARRQGISISLLRVSMVLANGRAYASECENVHRVVTDLNIIASDRNPNEKVQTVYATLPIPKGTTPTITLDKSQLLAISYFIRVQAFAQEGTYTTPDGKKSQFMTIDLPFIVGTLPSIETLALSAVSSGISTNTTTTMSSSSQYSVPTPTSPTFSSFNTATSSPINMTQSYQQNCLPTVIGNNSYTTISKSNILRKVSSGSSTTTVSSAPSNYTTATTGSNDSTASSSSSTAATSLSTLQNLSDYVEDVKKKKKRNNVFAKLRLYTSVSSGNSHLKQQDVNENTKDYNTCPQTGANTTFIPKSFCQGLALETMEESVEEVEENKSEQDKNYYNSHQQNDGSFQGGVFDLFPDDGFTDTEDEKEEYGHDRTEAVDDEQKGNEMSGVEPIEGESRMPIVFYPFVDSDTDEEDFEGKNNELISRLSTMSLSKEKGESTYYSQSDNKEYMKPNEYDHHKPNSKEGSNYNSINESEDDLLSLLAKKEEQIKKQQLVT